MVDEKCIHLVYTETSLFVTKREYRIWNELQDEYKDYKASLGPWSAGEVIDFLGSEYPNIYPSALNQITKFINGLELTMEITFVQV